MMNRDDQVSREKVPFRTGRKLGRTIYHHDQLIGMMDSEGWASIVVEALNDSHARPSAQPAQAWTSLDGQAALDEANNEIARLPTWSEELRKAVADEREACALLVERIRDDRFAEFGITKSDTNASYYPQSRADLEVRDEEDEDIAAAIRARAILDAAAGAK